MDMSLVQKVCLWHTSVPDSYQVQLHFLEFTFNGVITAARRSLVGLTWAFLVTSTTTSTSTSARCTINRLGNLVEGLHERFTRGFDARHIISREGRANICDLGLQFA